MPPLFPDTKICINPLSTYGMRFWILWRSVWSYMGTSENGMPMSDFRVYCLSGNTKQETYACRLLIPWNQSTKSSYKERRLNGNIMRVVKHHGMDIRKDFIHSFAWQIFIHHMLDNAERVKETIPSPEQKCTMMCIS